MAKSKQEWNEQPCPHCREPVHYAATRCHHCHADIAADIVQKRIADHKAVTRGCLIAAVAASLLLLGYCTFFDTEPDVGKAPVNGPPARPAVTSSQPVPAADRQALVRSYWRAVLGAGMPCESESKATMDAIEDLTRNPSGLVDAYDAARAAQSVCSNAWSAVDDIELAEAAGPRAVEAAEQASALCSDLYFSRRQGMGQIMEMLDGDVSASAQSDLRARSDEVGNQQIGCIARLAAVGEHVGLDISDLQAVIAEVDHRETP